MPDPNKSANDRKAARREYMRDYMREYNKKIKKDPKFKEYLENKRKRIIQYNIDRRKNNPVQRQKYLDYMRQYNNKIWSNPEYKEFVKEKRLAYYTALPEEEKARRAEAARVRMREYYHKNKDKISACRKKNRQNKQSKHPTKE